MRVAGIMSGTSLDGIDVAVVDLRGNGMETIGWASDAVSEERARGAAGGVELRDAHVRDFAAEFLLPELYAKAFFAACKQRRIAVKRWS